MPVTGDAASHRRNTFMDDWGIRPEVTADQPLIRDVHVRAFGRDNEADLVDKLRAGGGFANDLSLVATASGAIAGHILFTPIRVGTHAALALAPMAVLPQFQNRGIGSALVIEGLARCARRGHGVIIVVGHEHYYPRFGFVPARPRGIESPFRVPDDAWMVFEACAGALTGVTGLVEYPSAFMEA